MNEKQIQSLITDLGNLEESDRLFNPYAPHHGEKTSIRRANFQRFLTYHAEYKTNTLMILEAPGYRGCTVSGIPITSERIMLKGPDKWGIFKEGYQTTSDNPDGVAEMSATILWHAINENLSSPPLLWNAFPLHPHKPGNRGSNRTPTTTERRSGLPFIHRMITGYQIEHILAVGRKAQTSMDELGLAYVPLRHPSQGGKADFVAGLKTFADAH